MAKKLLASLLLTGGLLTATSASATLYTFQNFFDLPCTAGCVGNLTADATIVTDALGSLAPANIVDWTIVLNSTNAANTTLTPANSQGIFGFSDHHGEPHRAELHDRSLQPVPI